MRNLIEWLKGKKTYLIAGTIVILGFLQGTDIFVLPDWCWPILGACGLATIRAGVNKVSSSIK